MRRHVFAFVAMVAVLAGVPSAFAQTRPDFTGTWVVESIEAPRPPEGGFGGRRGGGRGRGMPSGRERGGAGQGAPGAGRGRGGRLAGRFGKGERVSMTQTTDTLVIVRESGGHRTSYALDGRETSSPGAVGGAIITSTTQWEGVALVTKNSQAMREVRTLGDDGRTMSLVMSSETPRGEIRTTVTFTRATT